MGWGKQPPTPNTIDDGQWQSLQDRARKANPDRMDVTSNKAAELRKAAARQFRKREQS